MMHSFLLFFVVLLSFCCQSAFGQVQNNAYKFMLKHLLSHSVEEISIKDFHEQKATYVTLDAREKEEYQVSHIEDALFVGYDSFSVERIKTLPKETPIVVYCSIGYRSEKIAEQLIKDGFLNVSNLYGGIFEWVNQEHSVVDSLGPTNFIHAYDLKWGVWLNKGKKVY